MRFSYAVVALIGAAQAMPHVGSLVTGRSICNDASADCKGVARAVVADQAALEARKKSKAAKGAASNATAAAAGADDEGESNNDKRSKKLFNVAARAKNQTEERRSLGDVVDGAVGTVTGTVGDVAGTVGLKRRDGKEVRAEVTDEAALDAREGSKEAKSAASNGTAEAKRALHNNKGRSANLVRAPGVTDEAALDAREGSKEAKSAASNGTAEARKARKVRKARRSHQLW